MQGLLQEGGFSFGQQAAVAARFAGDEQLVAAREMVVAEEQRLG